MIHNRGLMEEHILEHMVQLMQKKEVREDVRFLQRMQMLVEQFHTSSDSIPIPVREKISKDILRVFRSECPVTNKWICDMVERAFLVLIPCCSPLEFDTIFDSWVMFRYSIKRGDDDLARASLEFEFDKVIGQEDPGVIALRAMKDLYIRPYYETTDARDTALQRAYASLEYLNTNVKKWKRYPVFPPMNKFPLFTSNPFFSITYSDTNVYGAMQGLETLYQHLLQDWYLQFKPKYRKKDTGKLTGKPRIGFLSRMLGSHSVGRVSYGLIERLSEWFDIFVYVGPSNGSIIDERITKAATKTTVITHMLENNVNAILADNLHALVYLDPMQDLLTYIMATFRLAPHQISTWGHPGTTGISTIDSYVSSVFFDARPEYYTENLVTFKSLSIFYRHINELIRPHSFPTFDLAPYLQKFSIVRARSLFGIPLQPTRVYGLVAQPFKISVEFDDVIAKILQRDKQGILVVHKGGKVSNTLFDLVMERCKKKMDPDAAARILVLEQIPDLLKYCAYIYACDVILDTFPFGGLISAYDTLSCGRCMVALPGQRIGKFTEGFYRKMGVKGLIASDVDDFVEIAYSIANNDDYRDKKEKEILANLYKIHEDEASVTEWRDFFFNLPKV